MSGTSEDPVTATTPPTGDDPQPWQKWTQTTPTNNNHGDSPGHDVYQVPTSVTGPEYTVSEPTVSARKYCVIMVGLPARGKTFLAHKLCRLLGWLGHRSTVYNVQRTWREKLKNSNSKASLLSSAGSLGSPTSQPRDKLTSEPDFSQYQSPRAADYNFRENPAAKAAYTEALKKCAAQAAHFFDTQGLVAFINDDFTTQIARDEAEALFAPLCDALFYIEVIRGDNGKFSALKITDPTEYYGDLSPEAAMADFEQRVDLLRSTYEHVGEDKNYIKIRNGEYLEIHGVHGYTPSRMVSFLLNLSQFKVAHPIYFSRHGESTYNIIDRIGGNPTLTEQGQQDAQLLKDFIGSVRTDMKNQGLDPAELQIWSSQLTRTIQTAKPAEEAFNIKGLRWSCLNEIHAGVCEGLTYDEIKERYPLIHEFRKLDKYAYRYPMGESYQDLVARLEPIIMELENSTRPVVVVAHQAVLRALLAYFGTNSAESSVHVEVPHRTVWRCTYNSTGIASVDTIKLGEKRSAEVHPGGYLP